MNKREGCQTLMCYSNGKYIAIISIRKYDTNLMYRKAFPQKNVIKIKK